MELEWELTSLSCAADAGRHRASSIASTSSATGSAASTSESNRSGHSDPISIVSIPLNSLAVSQAYSFSASGGSSESDDARSTLERRDLLPPFTASPSGSSSGRSRPSMGLWGGEVQAGRSPGVASCGRRVVSAPSPYSSSPRSPLSGGASFAVHDGRHYSPSSPTWHRPAPRQSLSPSTLPLSQTRASSPSTTCPSPKSRRRHSDLLSTSAGSTSTPFGTLVGSYENSLLTGRMSALPSHPLPFLASIGVLGSPDSPTKLRCPPHLNVEFGAYFFTGPEGTLAAAAAASPYVGTLDLAAYYLSLLAAFSPLDTLSSSTPPPPGAPPNPPPPPRAPKFPGYRIPRRGQLQLVVKNPNSTAIKLFLVPYDLTGLDRNGQGGKTFLRQKSYSVDVDEGSGGGVEPEGGQRKGRLRYAVHLQFCSPPTSPPPLGKSKAKSDPVYYLYHTIRVVFASRAIDSSETLRVVAEGPEGELEGGSLGSEARFAPYGGPGEEWEMARRKAKAREKVRNARAVAWLAPPPRVDYGAGGEDTQLLVDDDGEEHGNRHTDYASVHPFRSASPFSHHLLSTPPSPSEFSPPSMSLSSLSHTLPAYANSSPLRFDRSASPVAPLAFDPRPTPAAPRACSNLSGISSSRPTSPEASDGRLSPEGGVFTSLRSTSSAVGR